MRTTELLWGKNVYESRTDRGHQRKLSVFSCTVPKTSILVVDATGWMGYCWAAGLGGEKPPRAGSYRIHVLCKEVQAAVETSKARAIVTRFTRCFWWRREAGWIAGQHQNNPPGRKPLRDRSLWEPEMWLKLEIISPALLHRVHSWLPKLQTICFCETVIKDRQACKNRHHSSSNPSTEWVCLWQGENHQVTKACALAKSN